MLGNDFRRAVRITQKADFNRVFDKAEKTADRYFTLLFRPNNRLQPRIGLAISKKVSKSAVVRNRLKRIIRESFRTHQQRLIKVDIVVIARSSAADQENKILFTALQRHWGKLSDG